MHSGFKNLDEYLAKYDKFIISTHESPDADGIGAEIAFNELLISLGKKTIIFNSDPLPDTLEFLDIDREINILDSEEEVPPDINEYAQIVLDTNDFDNIGSAYHILKNRVRDIFIIDHHEGGDPDKFDTNFIRAEASSASEIVYEIISYYGKGLTYKSAQAIYTGMLFDTGSFRYPKTTPLTYRIAAECVELGANPFKIYEHLYESNSLSSFALRSHILSTMEVLKDGKMIAMKLTPEMLRKTGASFTEGEPVINVPLSVKGVVASILVKQDIVGPVKVSMRTKGDIDVAKLAMDLGGGGHKNAAGYKSKLSFEETYERAIKSMEPFFNN
ncbi:MAG TPA: bifunctional oligoribonuclease/PAP phosphatase NrnA [Spirochaetota bacterium]|nr:bifunctional oligoribonuclease/PAP phosphatase NrnA [Spirochaetota bacterium]HPI88691.1 bifunctional oligoribonuclease/PAP phosphatase NrnA [Spirochaetota bacterium]HPR48787.1 bifunctional oligoribonuclease/PAP phosphatase NrnA [Spirochaetota bacterium]